ncbi:hypothetical protein CapIbe_019998 [Capra ibex]
MANVEARKRTLHNLAHFALLTLLLSSKKCIIIKSFPHVTLVSKRDSKSERGRRDGRKEAHQVSLSMGFSRQEYWSGSCSRGSSQPRDQTSISCIFCVDSTMAFASFLFWDSARLTFSLEAVTQGASRRGYWMEMT